MTEEPFDTLWWPGRGAEGTVGCQCLCNALTTNVDLNQHRPDGYVEPALLTLGQDLGFLPELLGRAGADYSAGDAVRYLLADERRGWRWSGL